jgi:modification methylase
VLADGKLQYKDQTGSIHRIGAMIQQTPSCNGWKFWHIMRNDKLILIDDLRTEYFRKQG